MIGFHSLPSPLLFLRCLMLSKPTGLDFGTNMWLSRTLSGTTLCGLRPPNCDSLTPSRPTFSVNSIRRCLKRKSSRSATGLDGVSRLDLLALGDADLQLLLHTLSCAGQTGAWPQQVLNGYVRSLAKTEDPLEVGHYRPITVFSQWYRAWSSISARHWLAQLSQVVDPFLCGNVVGCRAGMVWRHVLEQVEAAHRDQTPICGYSADIVKAFNVLPRRPVFIAAKLLGLDQATLVAWAGALSGFVRHFVVRGSVSPGVDSNNGFPEGCAMSCVAMLLLTQLFHKWMVACNAMFRPVSYVDKLGCPCCTTWTICAKPLRLWTALQICSKSSLMPRSALLGVPMLMAAKPSEPRLSGSSWCQGVRCTCGLHKAAWPTRPPWTASNALMTFGPN